MKKKNGPTGLSLSSGTCEKEGYYVPQKYFPDPSKKRWFNIGAPFPGKEPWIFIGDRLE